MKKLIVAGVLLALFSTEARAQGRIFGMESEFKDPPDLVATVPYSQPEGIGDALIVEFDFLTGATLNSYAPPVPAGFGPDGLAFDGATLWFLATDSGGSSTIVAGSTPEGPAAILYALDPDDGAVLDTFNIAGGSGEFDGLAALNGRIYILDYFNSDILVFDPAAGNVIATLDIDGTNPGQLIVGGLGAIDQPDELLVTGRPPVEGGNTGLLRVDPATGVVLGSFPLDTLFAGFTGGVATVGQQIYAADSNIPVVVVYDRSGGVIDVFNGTGPFYALGGDPLRSVEIPTASTLGLALLALLLVGGGLLILQRKARTA